jgi:hypothetical protein
VFEWLGALICQFCVLLCCVPGRQVHHKGLAGCTVCQSLCSRDLAAYLAKRIWILLKTMLVWCTGMIFVLACEVCFDGLPQSAVNNVSGVALNCTSLSRTIRVYHYFLSSVLEGIAITRPVTCNVQLGDQYIAKHQFRKQQHANAMLLSTPSPAAQAAGRPPAQSLWLRV